MNNSTTSRMQGNLNQSEKDKVRLILAKRLEKNQERMTNIPRYETNVYAVSSVQQHMLEYEAMNDKTNSYNIVSCVNISGELDLVSLENGINCLIKCNSSLRTKFVKTINGYQQIVEDYCKQEIEFKDISDEPCQKELIEEIVESEIFRKIQLDKAPLMNIIVIRQAPERFVMILTMHHTVTDGWSFGVMIHQLQDYYNAYRQRGSLIPYMEKTRYIDYCIWNKSRVQDAENYWKKELYGSRILRLECDWERKIQASYQGRRLYFTVEQSLVADMRAFERLYQVTMSNIMMSAYQILLSKYTGQKDFVIGMAVANRELLEINHVIGCFINTLAMRTILDKDMQIKDYLKKVQEQSYEVINHKNVDLYGILEGIQYEKDNRFPPLFSVMYNYENTPKTELNFAGLEVCAREVETCSALFDLTLSVFDGGKDLTGFIEYKSELFKQSRMEQMFCHLMNVLAALIKHPDLNVKAISFLSAEQEAELLEFNKKQKVEYQLFSDRFKWVVSKWGSREAVYFEGSSLTYSQLDAQSDKAAHMLLKQVPPKSLIGVYMDKSLESIVAILSILKAGMIYVPLDPDYPLERIYYIIKDAGINLVITQISNKNGADLQAMGVKSVVSVEDMLNMPENWEYTDIGRNANPEDIAYIIYTSGSTGNPKGVMVPHRGLCNVIEEQERLFSLNEKSRVLQFASFCFDASVFEIIMALGNGAALYLADRQKVLGNYMAKFIDRMGITHICVTPSVLALTNPTDIKKLEAIIVAGEACPGDLAEIWSRKYKLFNAYGPTEATIWTTTSQCFPGKKVTIGKPLNNVETYIMDHDYNLVPKGSIGELYIGGIGLCKGYLHQDELNRRNFIRKRFSNGYETDLYASGDMVRLNENDEIEFICRKDNQVKIRGFRIETDEIRTTILTCPDVLDAVVGVFKRNNVDVLYTVIKSDAAEMTPENAKSFLKKKLPGYMIPDVIKIVQDISLSLNGKVDYKSLEQDLLIHEDKEITVPETELQYLLQGMWKEILGIESIGIDDNFFDMGGHSLTATKLVNRINERFSIEFTTSMIFNCPTILEMEESIKKLEVIDVSPLKRVGRQDKMKLSSQQKRLWFMEQMYQNNGSYNIVTPIHFMGNLDIEVLEKSFCRVIENHEILNVSFHEERGIPYQSINYDRQFRMTHYHIMNFDEQIRLSQVNRLISVVSERGFDLSKDLLIRASLIHLSDKEYVLVIVIHHIISDGWSMELLIDELSKTYNQFLNPNEIITPPGFSQIPQYIDYIYWLDQQKEVWNMQEDYWKRTLDPDMAVVSVPEDYKRPRIQTHNGNSLEQEMDETFTLKIKKFCSDKKITTFMFMMAAFSVLLHKLTSSNDIPVGVPAAGRPKKEMEVMIGLFVNTLVMRCHISDEKTIAQTLEDIKKVSLKALEHQDVPFEDIVQIVCPDRDLSRSPLIQVMLNVQNPDGIQCHLKEVKAVPYPVFQESTKFDLTLYVEEYFERLKLKLVYNCDLYQAARMQECLNQMNAIMETMLLDENSSICNISIQSSAFKELLKKNGPLKLLEEELVKLRLEDGVAETAKKYPDRIAVMDQSIKLTYQQLEETAGKLAGALAEKDIKRHDIVIIYGKRNVKLVVLMLAVLKTGAAFCIFDPEYPEQRLKQQFDAVHAKGVVFIKDEIPHALSLMFRTLSLCETYDELIKFSENRHLTSPQVLKACNDAAYVLFTSGTTGIPNCVSTSHAPVSHFIAWFVKHYDINQSCIFGLFAGLSHDPLLREVFTPFFVGGRLAIQNRESQYDMEDCVRFMEEQKVNEVNITPSLFMMLTEGSRITLPEVRHYFFGGESLGAVHIERVRKISPQAKCVNFYGATETPQVMGYYDVPETFDIRRDLIPIQHGIDEVQLYVVNEHGLGAGVGEPGEIYIRTPHLSNGYLNNEALNREKFISSNTPDGFKIYKTGDIGRYQCDGSIVLEGRKDEQVNVRGYRIEIREIELALSAHGNVLNAVVGYMNISGRKQVTAYLVMKDRKKFDSNEIRRFLITYLPVHAMPERFVLLDTIPLTPNGKVDYRKLPRDLDLEEAEKNRVLPRNEMEESIKQIWSKVLDKDNFGIDDNFFDVGGQSLLLVQVKVLLEEAFNVELRLMDLFNYPSIALFSDYMKSKKAGMINETDRLTEKAHDRAKLRQQSFGKFKRIRE
ncbi:MAG: amino acid adenylation domain-containing protein [Hungatella sp.]|jgi:amino acid adenylation domain-containing protein|nr:amino acid adenylation domain-containing protein [Hungatella sp.]